jgi:FdhD protein
MISSGRLSSEIVRKAVRGGIPILISISAPTSLGVKTADAHGITLIASVRGRKFEIFTNDWRVV